MSLKHYTTLTLSLFLLFHYRNPESPYLPWLRLLPVPEEIKRLSDLTEGGKDCTDLLLLDDLGK